ncbi:MAG: popeye domain-containing protein [Acidobacteria bacterium]|nr:popeye domain-containing protein [Acidobacteriota bacterium]MCI0718172.1 popeye domain-containing protein [Acidobacteriota bacterium]
MPKEKIAFQTNIPVEVQLAYADGKKVTGQYGDSFMYTLRGDRVMFVPPFVRERIQELQPQAGQWFSICKREVQASEGKTRIDWEVLLCGSRGGPASGSVKGGSGHGNNGSAPASQSTSARQSVAPSSATDRRQDQANQSPQQSSRNATTLDRVADMLSSSGRVPQNGESPNGETPKPNGSGYDAITLSMKKAFQGALEATKAIESYADAIGFQDRNGDPFRFSHLDLRSIGLSMFIEARKRSW